MLIDIHTHHVASEKILTVENILIHQPFKLLAGHSYSAGLHPWYLPEPNGQNLQLLENTLQNPQIIAIGEAGLDRVFATNFDLQTDIFFEQILLSEKYQKPLIIHCVRAYQDIITIKKQSKASQSWIIHGFSGNLQTAEMLIKHHCFMSFGEMLWKNEKVQQTFQKLPLDKVFLETDVSAINIEDLYERAATLRNIDKSVLEKQIWDNFAGIFQNFKLDLI
jgi:TatD DNase family protein